MSARASDQDREILTIGHRGCAGLRPENTMAAFNHAFNMDLGGIEFDVHLTKDGEVVVNHDYYLNPYLTRSINDAWVLPHTIAIVDHDYLDLQSYKLGKLKEGSLYETSHRDVKQGEDESLPTLGELLKAAKNHPTVQLHIELKTDPFRPEISSHPKELVQAVLKTINESGIKEQCSILAFDWRVLKIVRDLDVSIPLVFLFEDFEKYGQKAAFEQLAIHMGLNPSESIPKMVAKLGGTFWSVHHPLLTKENIQEAHSLGLKVNAWTPNSPEEMRTLMSIGVDAITTDRPDILLNLLKFKG